MSMPGPFGLETLKIDPTDPKLVPARGTSTGTRIRKSRYFVKVPWSWVEKLHGASGQAYQLALNLLFRHWQGRGASITLANCMLKADGIPRETKRRVLRDLESRGLVVVDWRQKRSPIVRVLADL
jgi:hypothetical protein